MIYFVLYYITLYLDNEIQHEWCVVFSDEGKVSGHDKQYQNLKYFSDTIYDFVLHFSIIRNTTYDKLSVELCQDQDKLIYYLGGFGISVVIWCNILC